MRWFSSYLTDDGGPDLTPLIDVLIPMLIASLLLQGGAEALTSVDAFLESGQGAPADITDSIVITCDATGSIYWNDERVGSPSDLTSRVSVDNTQDIALRCDARVPYGVSYQIKEALRAAGVRQVTELGWRRDE